MYKVRKKLHSTSELRCGFGSTSF